MTLPPDFNSAFFLALGTMIFAFCGLIVRYSYKSKCKNVSCCCLNIERDIEDEIKEDLAELQIAKRTESIN